MPPLTLIHHAAHRGLTHPGNSPVGLVACVEAGARIVEIDVQALADGDYALLHDSLLEDETTGQGPVSRHPAGELAGLRLRWDDGRPSDDPVGLLSQVVALLRDRPAPVELQLDLKAYPTAPLTDDRLCSLLNLVAPLGGRVRVSTTADWVLRRLHALDADCDLGFDPLQYLDLRPKGEGKDEPPYRTGAYGYRGDHPLAAACSGPARDYLAERAEALWLQAPMVGVWYIRAQVLARALDDGFDWIEFLHARGVQVDAWTLDPSEPAALALACRLVEAGVDRITTNDAPRMAKALGGQVIL